MVSELISLVELCDIDKNNRNEGIGLKSLLDKTKSSPKEIVISIYRRNNHALVSKKYRYIGYENGAEEL